MPDPASLVTKRDEKGQKPQFIISIELEGSGRSTNACCLVLSDVGTTHLCQKASPWSKTQKHVLKHLLCH